MPPDAVQELLNDYGWSEKMGSCVVIAQATRAPAFPEGSANPDNFDKIRWQPLYCSRFL